MLKLIVHETENLVSANIKQYLTEYVEQQKFCIKIIPTNDIEQLIKSTKRIICLIDYDIYLQNKKILQNWQNQNKVIFIFVAKTHYQMIDAIKKNENSYCLLYPIKQDSLVLILDYIKQNLRSCMVIVKKGYSGEEIVAINDLNYIDIANRSLRFHMTQKKEIYSQTLHTSFAKETAAMLKHQELYFMAPSLLVNLENIKELYPDHMIFKNGEIAYYPKTQYEKLRAAWFEFHQI